jgi:hypothetical protein
MDVAARHARSDNRSSARKKNSSVVRLTALRMSCDVVRAARNFPAAEGASIAGTSIAGPWIATVSVD